MHHNPANCLNCETVITPEQAFCSRCGQKSATHRLSLHELWHDVVHYLTHADKSIFKTFGALMTHPGKVASEYIAGKRARYFKPLNYFLIVAGLVVFMTSYFHVVDESRVRSMERYAAQIKDPVKQAGLQVKIDRMRQTNQFVSKYSNFLHMLATPMAALFFWMFYARGQYSYIEHLVANMYFVSTIMVFYALIVVPLNALFPNLVGSILLGLFFLFEWLYRAFAYYRLMGKKGAGFLWKAIGVSLFTVLVWIFGTVMVIKTYIETGFK